MKRRWLLGVLAVLALAWSAWLLASSGATTRSAADAPEIAAPEDVVSSFYGWYLRYIDHGGEMRNPLVDGAYRDRRELSAAFVGKVTGILAVADKAAYDPILLAQDIPERIAVTGVSVAGETARVAVEMFWHGNPKPSERTVTLALADGEWVITDVSF